MKVAFISNSVFDGAGIAAFRILESVQRKGVECSFFSNDPPSGLTSQIFVAKKTSIVQYFNSRSNWKNFRSKSLQVKKQYDYFTIPVLDAATPYSSLGYEPDIIHLHWINNILDFPSFFNSIPAHIPVIWTLHDMSPFTGGCIYSWDCEKFTTYCHECPQLPEQKKKDLSYRAFEIKSQLFNRHNLHLTADSFWMEKQAMKSALFKNVGSLQTIHYPIDTNVFVPQDKMSCREILGFSKDDFIICFGATYLDSLRKGMPQLLKALEIIYAKYKNIKCLVYGSNFQQPSGYNLPPIVSLGKIQSEKLQVLAYACADVFVVPSLQEAFGQTCLEAMCCGTPVVGFDVGGLLDMIKHGSTGLLAKVGDIQDLANQIEYVYLHHEERIQYGKNARDFAVQNFSMEVQGDKYLKLYKTILGNQLLN